MKKACLMSEHEAVQHALSEKHDTAGSLLREARISQGIDIDTLAALLKVPVQKLHMLEKSQFDLLPDAVFTRALASSMCRILKLDPLPVLQRLPAITAFKVTSQNRGINTPFRGRSAGQGISAWLHMSRPAVLLGIALLMGALIMIFLPAIQQEISRYQKNEPSAVPGEAVQSTSITPPAGVQASASSDASGVAQATQAGLLTPAEVAGFVSTPASSLPATADSNASADSIITFSAKTDSRIKVTDAKGVVVLDRMLRTGESTNASGELPLAVVVSRANAVQVQIRGQAFALAGVTKNNTARFEVK